MRSFATEFPINHKHQINDVINCIKHWILGSPHTSLTKNNFLDINEKSSFTSHNQTRSEEIQCLKIDSANQSQFAFKYISTNKGLQWTTEIVFSKTTQDSWISVQVSCESQAYQKNLPDSKKPIIVKRLLEDLGGANDGHLKVSSDPHFLSNGEIDLASEIINGIANCYLPVVYVSCGFKGDYLVDTNQLALQLSGMAHVIIEPNIPFSNRLRLNVASQNVYGGTIGVYWPDGSRRSYFKKFNDSSTNLITNIVNDIKDTLINRRPLQRCTWAEVQGAHSRQQIESFKNSGSATIDQFVEEFDKENKALKSQLNTADEEIDRLSREVRRLEEINSKSSPMAMSCPNERDLYPNEIKKVLRDALYHYSTNQCLQNSRKRHILEDALSSFPQIGNDKDELMSRLKNILKGYKKMDATIKKELADIGFAIQEDRRHYRLVFREDERYAYSIPKTGSDYRGGLNSASDIIKLIF